MKALFFAIENSNSNNSIAVYAIHGYFLNRGGINFSEDFPHYKFTFLHKQEGAFIYLPYADYWYIKYGKWPSIEDWMSYLRKLKPQDFPDFPIIKIIIDSADKNMLLSLLEKEGITKESLMPTYNHVAESVINNLDR